MVDPDDADSADVLWSRGPWRCQRRITAEGAVWAELFQGDELALTRPVKDPDQLAAVTESWREVLSGHPEVAVMPEPTRRRDGERRHDVRGGRRHDD